MITQKLEEVGERTYVAHYFFPTRTKRSDDEKSPEPSDSVQSALKYMAFQISRVNHTVQKALGKACDKFRSSANLDMLWESLKIGSPRSRATYNLLFDGLENLPEAQAKSLLGFIFGGKLARESAGRVRVLASGMDKRFANELAANSPLRIKMEDHNVPDMRIKIEKELSERNML